MERDKDRDAVTRHDSGAGSADGRVAVTHAEMVIAEDRVLAGEDEVTGKNQAGAPSFYSAVDLGDDRLFDLDNLLEGVLQRLQAVPGLVRRMAVKVRMVGRGHAENVILPRNDDHTDFIIEADLFQRYAQFPVTAGLGRDVILVVDQ